MVDVFMIRAAFNLLLCVVLSALTFPSFAETIPATGGSTSYRCQTAADISVYTGWFGSQEAACSAAGGAMGVGGFCRKNGGTGTALVCEFSQYSCPTGQNWSLNGNTCTRPDCISPQVRNPSTGVCEAPKCTSTGQAASGYFDMGTTDSNNPKSSVCASGCLAVYSGGSIAFSKLVNGVRHYYAKGSYDFVGGGNSDQCSANDAPASSSALPADSCAPGSVKFTVNNNIGCVSKTDGTVTSPTPTKTTTNTVTQNADGSSTVVTKTTDQSTGQTTTSTSTYPPGVSVPTLPGTTVTPSTGGSNGDDPSGDKDACEDDPERVGCKHLDEIVGDVPDPEAIQTDTVMLTINPASGFGFGSYACPSNPHITLRQTGQNITAWDWQPSCTFAEGIKPVVLAFAFLMAAYIGIGGVKN